MTGTDYEKQATDFLAKHGLTFKAEFVSKDCPSWSGDCTYKGKSNCPKCGNVHGWRYLITLSGAGRSLSFDYWNSYADTHHADGAMGRRDKPILKDRPTIEAIACGAEVPKHFAAPPTPYNVLAGVSLDAHCPPDFADFCGEYGYDQDSRKAEALHTRCVSHALKLTRFFTTDELEELAEIQ